MAKQGKKKQGAQKKSSAKKPAKAKKSAGAKKPAKKPVKKPVKKPAKKPARSAAKAAKAKKPAAKPARMPSTKLPPVQAQPEPALFVGETEATLAAAIDAAWEEAPGAGDATESEQADESEVA